MSQNLVLHLQTSKLAPWPRESRQGNNLLQAARSSLQSRSREPTGTYTPADFFLKLICLFVCLFVFHTPDESQLFTTIVPAFLPMQQCTCVWGEAVSPNTQVPQWAEVSPGSGGAKPLTALQPHQQEALSLNHSSYLQPQRLLLQPQLFEVVASNSDKSLPNVCWLWVFLTSDIPLKESEYALKS